MRRLPLRSPPRVRGKVPVCCPEHRKVRITPACAGKSAGRCIVLKEPYGSPPHVRGKETLPALGHQSGRITPACAGKSRVAALRLTLHRDHPRVCGEKRKDFETANRKKGSPPRMRGKGCMFCCSPAKVGITPAYAGKSLLCMDFCPAYRDHPRVCGEKQSIILL